MSPVCYNHSQCLQSANSAISLIQYKCMHIYSVHSHPASSCSWCFIYYNNNIGVSSQPWPPHSVLVALYAQTCTCQPLTVSHNIISPSLSAELLGQIKQLLLSQHGGQTSKSFIYNTHAVGILLINMHSVFRLLTPVNQHHPLGYVIHNIIGLPLTATTYVIHCRST